MGQQACVTCQQQTENSVSVNILPSHSKCLVKHYRELCLGISPLVLTLQDLSTVIMQH